MILSHFKGTAPVKNHAYLVAPQVGVVAYAIGDYGTAKTATIRALAEYTNRHLFLFELTQHLPEDMSGYPTVTSIETGQSEKRIRTEVMKKARPIELVTAEHEDSIIYLDELSNVNRQRQAAALSLMATPPKHAWVYASGNPIAVSVDGYELAPPAMNRLLVVEWEPPIDSWLHGMHTGGEFQPPVLPVVDPDSDEYQSMLRLFCDIFAMVVEHCIETNTELFSQTSNENEATCTMRSLYNAARILAALAITGATEEEAIKALDGTIGEDARHKLFNVMSMVLKTDPCDEALDINSIPRSTLNTWLADRYQNRDIDALMKLLQRLENSDHAALIPVCQGFIDELSTTTAGA